MSRLAKLVDFSMQRATNEIKRNMLNMLLDLLPEGSRRKFHEVIWKSGVPDSKLDHALLQCENTLKTILKKEREDTDATTN